MFERAAVFSALIVFVVFGHIGLRYFKAVENQNSIEIAR